MRSNLLVSLLLQRESPLVSALFACTYHQNQNERKHRPSGSGEGDRVLSASSSPFYRRTDPSTSLSCCPSSKEAVRFGAMSDHVVSDEHSGNPWPSSTAFSTAMGERRASSMIRLISDEPVSPQRAREASQARSFPSPHCVPKEGNNERGKSSSIMISSHSMGSRASSMR